MLEKRMNFFDHSADHKAIIESFSTWVCPAQDDSIISNFGSNYKNDALLFVIVKISFSRSDWL